MEGDVFEIHLLGSAEPGGRDSTVGRRDDRRGQSGGPRLPLDASTHPDAGGIRRPGEDRLPPRELAHAGSPGSDPEDGDLIYYVPWGNLGFYYNAAGIDYSDQTIHFGTYDASLEQLDVLEGPDVIVEVVR